MLPMTQWFSCEQPLRIVRFHSSSLSKLLFIKQSYTSYLVNQNEARCTYSSLYQNIWRTPWQWRICRM